jgi:uncharacterized membrane protein
MPPLMLLSIAASAGWLALAWRGADSAARLFLALGTLLVLSSLALSVAVNVPINRRLESWNAASPPADARELWARWERAHAVRVWLEILGFASQLLALRASIVAVAV